MAKTWRDTARRYWPQASDEEIDALLWNATCFPLGSLREVKRQLKEAADRSACNVGLALKMADDEMNAAMNSMQTGDEQCPTTTK